MFKIILLTLAIFLLCGSTNAQTDPQVCISQESANRCATAAAELIEARSVIVEFQVERGLSEAERQAAQKLISGLNDLVEVKTRVIASYEQINTLYKQSLELQMQIIERYQNQLMKGKGPFDKFLDAIKTLAYLAAGIALGRGF